MLATVASLTSANRIKRRSIELGIYTSIIQTPGSLAKEGCGYSIRFDDSSKNLIESISSELGIRIRAFYTENLSNGKKTYERV